MGLGLADSGGYRASDHGGYGRRRRKRYEDDGGEPAPPSV